jgi:arylsulfatase A-like enzyme
MLLWAPLILLPALATISIVARSVEAAKPAKNVLLVVLDTLRRDRLGCYGYARRTSPEIDSLASSATRFTRAFSTSSWTVPSHASLFTGRFPFEHGAHLQEERIGGHHVVSALDDGWVTLAELLASEGYSTAAFVANAGFLAPAFKLDRGFDLFHAEQVPSHELAPAITTWLGEAAQRKRPFFLFVNFVDTHRPYNARPRPGLFDPPATWDEGELFDALFTEVMHARRSFPHALARRVIDQYDTAVANLDDTVGHLLRRLEALGLYNETLIVITSDHGEYLGEHELVGHAKDLYQETNHIPLLMKAAYQLRPHIDSRPVSLVDIPALITDQLCGSVRRRGRQLFPNRPGSHPVLMEIHFSIGREMEHRDMARRFERTRTAIVDWPYKLIHSSDGEHALFNVEEDPTETRNLFHQEPRLASRLQRQLEAYQLAHRAPAPQPTEHRAPNLEGESLQRLRALGYVE